MRNLSILTGQMGSTYYRFGQDIARVLQKECGAGLEVKSSAGSMENLRRLRKERFTQLAIVQQDILEYIRIASGQDAASRDLIDGIRYVFPLYTEEVHLLTTKESGIASLRDLKGRRVSVGALESGTFLTAKMILWLTGTSVEEVVASEITALQRLLLPQGAPDRIDAMFYVVGKPVAMFGAGVRGADRLDLVPITEPAILRKYQPTQITARDYPWLKRTVDTVKVGSVLMTFDYKNNNCLNVGMIANRIRANLETLREKIGHPKWAEVDLGASVPGWQVHACIQKYWDVPVTAGSGARLCRFGMRSGEAIPDEADACARAKDVNNPIVQTFCDNFEKLRR